MVEPPSWAVVVSPVKATVTWPAWPVPTTAVGAAGSEVVLVLADAADDADVPLALVAVTV